MLGSMVVKNKKLEKLSSFQIALISLIGKR